MGVIDWALVVVPLLIVLAIGIYTQRYANNVAGFMAGNRLAGRYLLAVSRGEMQAGAVVFVAYFEVIAKAGFTITWWSWLSVPLWLILGTTGFVIYRYRETRALTLAQFFEIRYNKSFRVFTGALGFLAGLANFGIIPAIGARFLVGMLGLPQHLVIFSHVLPTYIPLMAVFLSITLFITLAGGMLTVMLADCVEGIISQILYLVIIASLLSMFNWTEISQVLGHRLPEHSLLNPFDSQQIKDFNIWSVLMGMFGAIYGTMAWQYQSASNSAALSAHESRMAGILGRWRESGRGAVVTLLGICGLTYMLHPDFATQAAHVQQTLSQMDGARLQDQMRIPMALSELLPVGAKGALCVILLMGIFGGDSTHLHSWGGIFVQDVLVPLRRKPFTPRQHILMLRLSIAGVALFAFLFGCFFRQTEYITMWWSVTTALFVSGAGAAIIGGLYWKKGTAAGAWASFLTGSTLCVSGIIARQIHGDAFPLNGLQISFFSCIIASLVYVVSSLLTARSDFNMERMLHRGPYAAELPPEERSHPGRQKKSGWLARLFGIDDEYTLGDRWITGALSVWSMMWVAIFLIGTAWNLIAPWPESVWSTFWKIAAVGLPIFLCVVTSIWFTWGGTRDIFALFRRLQAAKINNEDDGTVVDHHNLGEPEAKTKPSPQPVQ